jgi:hypothetical protein
MTKQKYIIQTVLRAVLDAGAGAAVAGAAKPLYALPVAPLVALLYATAVLVLDLVEVGLNAARWRSAALGAYAPRGSATPRDGRRAPGWRVLPVAAIAEWWCMLVDNAHRSTVATFVAASPAATLLVRSPTDGGNADCRGGPVRRQAA